MTDQNHARPPAVSETLLGHGPDEAPAERDIWIVHPVMPSGRPDDRRTDRCGKFVWCIAATFLGKKACRFLRETPGTRMSVRQAKQPGGVGSDACNATSRLILRPVPAGDVAVRHRPVRR
jgi:hypothetical protein